jgi:hypothetical protein
LTISGYTFGFINYCPTLRVQGTSAAALGWISDSSLVTKVASGSKATMGISVSIVRRENILTEAASYDVPDIAAPTYSFYSAALGALGISPVRSL